LTTPNFYGSTAAPVGTQTPHNALFLFLFFISQWLTDLELHNIPPPQKKRTKKKEEENLITVQREIINTWKAMALAILYLIILFLKHRV